MIIGANTKHTWVQKYCLCVKMDHTFMNQCVQRKIHVRGAVWLEACLFLLLFVFFVFFINLPNFVLKLKFDKIRKNNCQVKFYNVQRWIRCCLINCKQKLDFPNNKIENVLHVWRRYRKNPAKKLENAIWCLSFAIQLSNFIVQ